MYSLEKQMKFNGEYLENDAEDYLARFMYQVPFFQFCHEEGGRLSDEMLRVMAGYIFLLGKEAKSFEKDFMKNLSAEQCDVFQAELQKLKEKGEANCYEYSSLRLLGYNSTSSHSNPIEEVFSLRTEYQEGVRGVFYDAKGRRQLEINTFTRYVLSRVSLLQDNQEGYYIYTSSGVYRQAELALLKQLFRKVLDEYDDKMWLPSYESQYMAALVGLVRIDNRIQTGDSNLVNFRNGVYNLKTKGFEPHSPPLITLVQLDYCYDPKGKCENFLSFLNDIFEDDSERVLLIQQMLGYMLLRDVKIHKAFIFLGKGSNGKSVLAELITHLLGKSNVSTTPLSKLNGTFAFQNMGDKLVNISSENEMKATFNTQDFKMLTAGDMVEVEKKYQDAISQRLTAKLLLLLNKMMDSDDCSPGYYRRLQIIPFNKTYIELKDGEDALPEVNYMNPCLIDELLEELPGIMNFAIGGLELLKENGFRLTPCRASEEALEEYKRQQNPIAVFVDECVTYSEGERIKRSEVTRRFEMWLQEQGLASYRRLSRQSVLSQFLEEMDKRQWLVKESKIQGNIYLTNLQFTQDSYQENIENHSGSGYVRPTI